MKENHNISVFLVDDERLIREGMKHLINWESYGFTICGEASNGRDALPEIAHTGAQIVISDIKMPFMDGLTMAKELKQQSPAVEIMILTGFDELDFVKESLHFGAFDFMLKPVSRADLVKTLERLRTKLSSKELFYPFDEENAVLNAINNNTDDLNGHIRCIFEMFASNRTPVGAASMICGKIMETIRQKSGISDCPLPDISEIDSYSELEVAFTDYVNEISAAKNVNVYATIEKIKKYIEENYQNDISLNTISSEFFFNKSYISRLFKSETGQNYNNFLIQVRIRHAKELLADPRLSIQTISERCGFGNSKYFSHLFKETVGMHPSQYRKENTLK